MTTADLRPGDLLRYKCGCVYTVEDEQLEATYTVTIVIAGVTSCQHGPTSRTRELRTTHPIEIDPISELMPPRIASMDAHCLAWHLMQSRSRKSK